MSVPDVKRGLRSKGSPKSRLSILITAIRMLFLCVFSFTFTSFTGIIVSLLAVVSTWSFATGDIIGFSWLFEALVKVWQLLFGLFGQDLLTYFELFLAKD